MDHIQYFPTQFLRAYNTLYQKGNQNRKLYDASREDQCIKTFMSNQQLVIALGAIFVDKSSSFSNDGKDKVSVKGK
jgi:hypothetical protein